MLDSQDASRERQINGAAKCLGEWRVNTCPLCGEPFPTLMLR